MRRPKLLPRPILRAVLGGALTLTALTILEPGTAQAGLVIRATVGAPVRATVVVGNAPHIGVHPRPVARRTVVTRAAASCCCGAGRRADVRVKHHRHHDPRKVWVPGHWERISRRTSRWIPGHWRRI
jgi:hypothetical protein